MNIESSHKFTRSGDTAAGCIDNEGVNLEDYQVGVVEGLQTRILETDTGGLGNFLYLIIVLLFRIVSSMVYYWNRYVSNIHEFLDPVYKSTQKIFT